MDNMKTNARKHLLTSLMLLSFSGLTNAGVSGLSQQELNKLGQSEAKQTKAIKGFKVSDSDLRTINPNYAETNLTNTYNSMKAPTEAGSAKKWQCLSYTDAQIQQFYKSSNATEKQLAVDCDAIRAAEKTNDKMDGNYGDPLENALVKMFTERQNEQIKKGASGDINIECSPLAGAGGPETEEACVVQMLPVEKTCTRELKVTCYNKETGQLLTGNETCGTDKLPPNSVSSLGNWSTSVKPNRAKLWNSYQDFTATQNNSEALKNTVYASVRFVDGLRERLNGGDNNPQATFTFKINLAVHPQPFIKYYRLSIENNQNHVQNPRIIINGTAVTSPLNRSGTYQDIEGKLLLGANLFKDGVNTVAITPHISDSNPFKRERLTAEIAIGFKNKCTEIVCNETWNESCVEGDVISGDDPTDLIIDD